MQGKYLEINVNKSLETHCRSSFLREAKVVAGVLE